MHGWKRWSRKYQRKSFDPDVSLTAVGLPQSEGEDLMVKMKDFLHVGLGCDTDTVHCLIAVEQLPARGHQPRIAKVEMNSVQEKVTLLRRKSNLRGNDSFNKVYVFFC